MRLIDANKLVQAIVEERNKIPLEVPCPPYEMLDYRPFAAGQNQRGGIRKALRCVEEAPTIDAVPVVRCKDCKHLMFSDFYGECGAGHYGIVRPEHFCSYGERKDGES